VDSKGEDNRTAGMVGTVAMVDMAAGVANRDTSMRRERLTHSLKGLGLFCRAKACRDTRKTSSI